MVPNDISLIIILAILFIRVQSVVRITAIDPLPYYPGKDQNISGHIVLAQNVCVI